MDNVSIRPARQEEAPFLSELALRSKAHWGYDQELLDTWSSNLAVQPESCDGISVWVIESENEIIGFGKVLINGESGVLDDLWIDPQFMGQGYGKQLFQHLSKVAAERGVRRLTLESDPQAVGFYERMGARIIGENPSPSVPGRVLPLMEVRLPLANNTTISSE